MKVAVAGKGGAGKTTFCAAASRLLARGGQRVVAIDGDTNPNLGPAMGVDPNAELPPFLPASLVARRFDGPRLTETIDEVLAVHAIQAPDGVAVLRMGVPQHADEGCMCSAHATVSAVLAELGQETLTVLDLEASPEHLSRGTARHADVLLLMAEPYFRSLEAVRLQATLAAETAIGRIAVVANKVRTADDGAAIAQFCQRHELELIGSLPWSDAVLDADAATASLIDYAPEDPVVNAVAVIVERLLGSDGPTAPGTVPSEVTA